MSGQQVIEQISNGEFQSRECKEEQSWHDLWRPQKFGARDPLTCALIGGGLADRLSWVFISGYQAALQHVFSDVDPNNWAALVASEDRDNPETRPGTKVTKQGSTVLLNGFKSWVAQSKLVQQLVVTAKDEEGRTTAFLIPTNQVGVSVTHRDNPSFLGDMSQGFVQFQDVDLFSCPHYSKDQIKQFGRCEPLFVMLSAAAFMLSHLEGADPELDTILSMVLRDLCLQIQKPDYSPNALAQADISFQAAAVKFEENVACSQIPSWQKDRGLLKMYSRAIQKRRQRDK